MACALHAAGILYGRIAVWYNNNWSYADSHTHTRNSSCPTLCSAQGFFSCRLLISLPLCSFSPHLFLTNLPIVVQLFFSSPYIVIFFDLSPFVSVPSHSAYWHGWRDLSLALYLCHCSFFPPLYLSFFLFVSLCLHLSLPPSLPHYLSTHTWFILHITEASIILLWEGEISPFFNPFFFLSVTLFSTSLFSGCLFFPKPYTLLWIQP